jgi:hypothetical protein
LNCYGFTKAKDDGCNSVENEDGRLWTFHHSDFLRDQPQLLSKIQRKSSSQTKEDTKKDPMAASITDTSNSSHEMDQERKELEKEIKILKGQLHSMEGIFQELAQKMSLVTMSDGTTATSATLTTTSSNTHAPLLLKHKKKIKLDHPTSANTLLNDKQLFDSKSSSTMFQTKVKSKHPLSIAKLVHSASMDLPDLGKIGTNDSHLYAGVQPWTDDQKRTCQTNELKTSNEPIDIPDSTLEEGCYALNDVDTSMDCALSYKGPDSTHDDEQNDVQTTKDDMVKSQPTQNTCSPTLIQDDCEEDKMSHCSSSDSVLTSLSLDTLLDKEHLENLESALRSLPIKERSSFVREVLSNIPDISSQGVTVLVLTEHENSVLTEQINPDCENLSLLSQMENLLGRVGLQIQLGGEESNNSTLSCSRSLRSSKKKKKSRGKDSSFVQIEA